MSLGFHVVLCAPAVCSVGSRLSLPQSRDGLFFGLINLVGNFSTVFIDQSYWQSAIAATPSASWKGFLLGGLCWFAIPYVFVACFFFFSVFCPELETDQDVGEFVEPYRRGLRPRDGQVLLPPLAAGLVMGSGD